MEAPVLNDQNQFPTEEIIFSNIGRTKSLWISLFEYIHKNYPDFSEVWRYFKDGKSWLFKVTFKSKTIFWLSVIKDSFRVTFYFNGKAEEAVNLSRIPGELKHQFSEKKDNKKAWVLTATGEQFVENELNK